MKNKIAIASAFAAASSLATAEIVINDFLSFEGFIDMSYSHTDIDYGSDNDLAGSDNSFGIDQVEIVWLFDFDPVTAQIDIDAEDGNGRNGGGDSDDGLEELEIEQAFATYSFEDGLAVTAGRYASMIGFEAFEPTGLYQYSFGYDMGFGDITIIPGYAQGVKVTYETEDMFFGASIQDEVYDYDNDRLGGAGDSSWGLEVAASFLFGDNDEFGWFVGGAYEDAEADTGSDGDSYMLNTYLTWESGAWIVAGELSYGESEVGSFALGATDEEVLQALLMANFAYSDQGSVTGRLSYADHEGDTGTGVLADEADFVKATLAHGWAFTDSLSLVTEISFVDGEIDSEDYEAIVGAVELIFAF